MVRVDSTDDTICTTVLTRRGLDVHGLGAHDHSKRPVESENCQRVIESQKPNFAEFEIDFKSLGLAFARPLAICHWIQTAGGGFEL